MIRRLRALWRGIPSNVYMAQVEAAHQAEVDAWHAALVLAEVARIVDGAGVERDA